MSEFEVLTIPLSLILGLGVTRVLGGLIQAIRHREEASLHWIPILWGFSILVFAVGYFNVLYEIDQRDPIWTWYYYGPNLIYSVLIFLGAGLIFPDEIVGRPRDMLDDFYRHGRLALVPIGALLATAPLFNKVVVGLPWTYFGNLLDAVLVLVIIMALVTTQKKFQAASALGFAAISIWGWLFVWSPPGIEL